MLDRKKPGAGGVEELPSGHWRVRLRLPGRPRYNSRPFATRAEAERHRNAVLAELGAAGTAPTGSTTLRQWAAQCYARREADPTYRSCATDRSFLARHILTAPFADWPLAQVTRRAVRDWARGLTSTRASAARPVGGVVQRRTLDRTLAASTADRVVTLLRTYLQLALDDELISENPARRVAVRGAADTRDAWTFLRADEIEALTTSPALAPWARELLTVAIYTGLRRGELWGLHWADVRLEGDRPEVTVRHSHRGPPKGRRVVTIPLLEPARAALERWRKIAPHSPDGLVFPNREGGRRGATDDAHWPELRARGGVTRPVRFHDLRHTCASHLIMGTWGRQWSLTEVCAYLRHKSVTTTMRYAHLSPDHLHNTAAATARGPSRGPRSGASRAVARESATVTERAEGESARGVKVASGPAVAHGALEAADTILTLAANGLTVPGVLITALVEGVLGDELPHLALAAREPGPHQLRRAIELASAVRRAADVAVPHRAARGRRGGA